MEGSFFKPTCLQPCFAMTDRAIETLAIGCELVGTD
jgi:hypothetical protein